MIDAEKIIEITLIWTGVFLAIGVSYVAWPF